MDLLRLKCFPKEREYLVEVSAWNQKMGFACLSIIERPLERRRLADQIGNMMVPDMCVSSTIDSYIADTFTGEHEDIIRWLSRKEKHAELHRADDNGPRASPAQHPLTLDSVPARPEREAREPDDVITEAQQPMESRTEENIGEHESENTDAQSDGGEEVGEDTNNQQSVPTPLSLCTLLKLQGRMLKAMKTCRSLLCKKAAMIDEMESLLPSPFIPLYNKAMAEKSQVDRRVKRQIKRLGYRIHRYLRLLEKETKLRSQIYQNLIHVTPLQVLLLGHLPRDQQMALLDVITSVRKFSVPLLISRFYEIQRVTEIEMNEVDGLKKIQI